MLHFSVIFNHSLQGSAELL